MPSDDQEVEGNDRAQDIALEGLERFPSAEIESEDSFEERYVALDPSTKIS